MFGTRPSGFVAAGACAPSLTAAWVDRVGVMLVDQELVPLYLTIWL